MKTTKFLLLIIAAFLITNTVSARDTHRLKNVASTITMNAEGVFWPRRHFRHERRHTRRAIIIARHPRRKRSF